MYIQDNEKYPGSLHLHTQIHSFSDLQTLFCILIVGAEGKKLAS